MSQQLTSQQINRLHADLTESAERIADLVRDLSEEQSWGPALAIVNPPRWEVGHVGWFGERWTLRNLYEAASLIANSDVFYNSAEVAHDTRWGLQLPGLEQALAYLKDVCRLAGSRLRSVGPSEHDAYFFRLSTFHSDMHTEAFTYTRQTLEYAEPLLAVPQAPAGLLVPEPQFKYGDVEVPGGTFMLGAFESEPFVFDNEKWAHPVEIAPFRISKTVVTNSEFRRFVDDGGYQRRELWSDEGWAWRTRENAEHPVYWEKEQDGSWLLRRYDRRLPLEEDAAIIHVNWFEACAYCAWAGRRLPSEAEWEAAAIGERSDRGVLSNHKRRFPWGEEAPTQERANLDWMARGVIDVRALPAGDSAFGCRQMMGNVWEWTSTTFAPYPGFVRDPYKEYSEPWFGNHMVLRGGCWTTRSRLIRGTWRNFYMPDRRDVFAGFRTCAK